MEQGPQRDTPETKEAIQRGYRRAREEWKQVAHRAVLYIARNNEKFTSADVDLAMMQHYKDTKTYDKRALGGIMRGAVGDGFIARTDEFIRDPRPNCHQKNTRVWKSLVYLATK